MKNFTNNFKQFTSRLSARWLIMALMMLVGTSSAWAVEYYLRGTFNDWGTNNPFSNNTCTITLAANQEYTFKITTSDWNNNNTYGKTNSHITETCEIELLNNTNNQAAGNCKITTKDAGSYTFVFTPNGSKGTLKVTYPTPTPTAPAVSTISATINGDDLVCEGKITSMGSATKVVWAFTVLNDENISKADEDWKYPKNQNQITAANTDFEYSIPISSLSLTSGTKYYVRAMAVDLKNLGWADNQYGNAVAGDAVSFVYDPCITLPDDAYYLSSNSAEWTGSDITLNINKKDNNYPTPSIKYNDKSTLPKEVGEYIVVATVSGDATYCDKTFNLGTFTITCPSIAAPDITTSATICAGTQVNLSAYNNSNTVKWYSNSACTAEVTQPVTPTDGTKYYAKAYHAASDCYSSQYSTLTFTVNPLPTISIGDNTNAVKFEDVKLTATGNNIDDVTWIADKGTITKDATDPKKAVLTYDQTGTVTVTATATSAAGCTSVAATKTVTFGEEKCSTGKTKIRFRKTYDTNEYYKFYVGGGIYLYAWNSYTNVKYTGEYPGKEVTKIVKVGNYDYYEYEFTESQSTKDLKIIVRATYDWCSNNYCEIGKTRDIALDVPGATYTLELANGDTNKVKQAETEHKKGDSNTNYDVYLFDVNKNSTGGGITITAPAVKTVSVTSDEDGNVTMVGQVVKTGCDTQAILGLQYKKQNPDGTTYEANYTTYPNPGTKEAISAGKTFTVTTKLEDGTYLVRARIDNSHATNGYGEDIKVVVNTTKTPISNVTLNYCDKNGGNVGVDPNPMCKGAIAYVKLSYVGSKYSDIKWLVEGVETNLVTDEGDGVWSYEIQGDGSLSVELKNDANTDPAWPYSNKLPFSIIPEPTAPYISIDPASGVICQGSSATIKVENPSKACSYKLVEEEEDPEAEFVEYESGDLKYSVGSVGKYYVAAKHKLCPTNEYTSNQVAINQIIRTNANISIEPEEAETTPWEPVSITVTADEGYIYEVTYTSNNLANVDGVIIKQNGDTYTYRIPRPDWGTGDASTARTPVTYGIKAQLKVDGEANQCDLRYDTATITVKDEENEDCD